MTTRFTVGQSVQLHPALDTWMRGDRYGTVVKLPHVAASNTYRVHLDKSDKTVKVHADNLQEVL